jgi:hypothetical protein
MKTRLPFLSCIVLVIVFVLVSGCTDKPSQQPVPDIVTPDKGVSFSPKSMDQAGLDDFFAKAGLAGGMVSWAGDWDDLSGGAALIS